MTLHPDRRPDDLDELADVAGTLEREAALAVLPNEEGPSEEGPRPGRPGKRLNDQESTHPAPTGPAWEPFQRLGLPSPPPFPVDALSPDLAAFVASVAQTEQARPDLAASLVLGAASAAAAWAPPGRSPTVAAGPMTEPLNLFCVAVEESGANKSGVFGRVLAPLEKLERELADDDRSATERAQRAADRRAAAVRLKVYEDALEDLAKSEATGKPWKGLSSGDLLEHSRDARLALDALPEIRPPRLLADDATPEALVPLLADNPCILVQSPEGEGVFRLSAGRYGNQPNLDTLLKGWGQESIRVDRRGRDPIRADAPTIALALAVQPSTIRQLGKLDGDLAERGALGRLLIAYPPTIMGHRHPPTGAGVPSGVRSGYERTIRRLFSLSAPPTDGDENAPMRLDPAAFDLFAAFYRETEAELGDGGSLAWLRSFASKSRSHLLRIAGLLHLADGGEPGTPIGASVTRRAVAITRYYLEHAAHAWAAMSEPPDLAATLKLWGFVRRRAGALDELGGLRAVTKRDLHTAAKGSFARVDELEGPLGLLAQHGYVAIVDRPTGRPGRPPSPWVVVSPEALDAAR